MGIYTPELLIRDEENYRKRARPEVGAMDVLGAAFEETRMDTTLGSFVRKDTLDDLHQTGPMWTKEDIQEKYKIPADRDMTEQEAIFIKSELEEQKTRRITINHASRSFLKGTVLPFVGGIAGAISDPLDFFIGAMTGGVAGVVGKQMGVKALGKFGIAAVENMVAGAITEVGVLQVSKAELKDYTAQQAFFNVVGGSLAMTGFIHGMKAGTSAISKMGRSHVNLGNKMAKLAEDNGLDVSKVIDFQEQKLQEKLNLDDGIVKATQDALGERAQAILEEVTNAKELVQAINKNFENGDISRSELENFKAFAEENGSSPERWNIVDEDSPVQFSEADIVEFQEKLNSNEFKLHESNPEATREPIKFEELQAEPEVDSKIIDLQERVAKDPEAKNVIAIKEYMDDADLNEESVAVIEKYLDCIGG